MKRAKSVALIGAGKFTDSSVSKYYWLSDRLGPVKSSSFRLASRIANHLRAGHAVKEYTELNHCALILVFVPSEMLAGILHELASCEIDFHGKSVVLCGAWLDSNELAALAARGASVASIEAIPGFDEHRYLIEGDRPAVLASRRLVEHGERRAVVIERSLKPLYLAALTCTGSVMFSVVWAAAEALRHAGVTPLVSASILEKQLGRTLRSFVRAGRKGFPIPRDMPRQLRALAAADPQLAEYLEQISHLAERLFEPRPTSLAASP